MGVDGERFKFGTMRRGEKNLITDVPGVQVGHLTRSGGEVNTGVTAVLPHGGNLFRDKVLAAAHVINGFGKSAGLVQVRELGTIEAPIVLTNTFSVGTSISAVVRHMLADNPDIGATTGTVNALVLECNDGYLNDIRGMHVTEADVLSAIASASDDFEEGAVGAGRGMSCYGLKGGIGSASRTLDIDGKDYTVGALLLTNFGSLRDLVVCGERLGESLAVSPGEPDRGSVIAVLATDIPLSSAQLERAARRVQTGLARTGTICGNGSGEIAVMFTTANRVAQYPDRMINSCGVLHEDAIDEVFRAVVESVEESVASSMTHAEAVSGVSGHSRESLAALLGRGGHGGA